MKKLIAAVGLLFASSLGHADNFNSVTVQGELVPPTPIYTAPVHILSGGQVVGTASSIDLVPDANGLFSTQTYITNPWIFQSGSDYVLRISSPVSGVVLSSFSITAVPFALTVRGDAQTGNQNVFGAYGNVGIGTSSPAYRLVISSAAGSNNTILVISTGTSEVIRMNGAGEIYANKYYGDGSALTGITNAGDNLGNHTATQALNLNGFGLTNASTSTFTGYINVVNGSGYEQWGSPVLRTDAGHYNAYLGYLSGTTLGNFNTFLGNYSGSNNSGDDNSFVGYFSGYSNSGGFYNSFVGSYAGANNTSGGRNTFMGDGAGTNVTTGSNNTLLGFGAGELLLNVNNNTFVGSQTGYNDGLGNNNSFLGHQAGYNNNSGSNNVFLGYQAGYNNSTGNNSIIIGANQTGGGDNTLNIGGVLYGNLTSRTIGIYRTTQDAALDVVSTGTASNVFAQIWRNSSGVVISSVSATGVMMATKFIGNGSGLTGISGDNLGNHTAVQSLNMANNQITNVSSLSVTGKDTSGYSLSLSSGIYMPAGTVTAGLFSGNGAALTSLNASSLANGMVADARLSTNVELLNANQTVSGVKTFTSSITVMGSAMVSSTLTVQAIMPANFVGGFMFFISKSSSCPAGWLKADGASVSKTAFPALFGMIDYMYGGSGDNFNLPNMTDGSFVRATGGNAAGQGTKQGYAIESHSHINQFGNMSTGSGSYGYLSINSVGNVYTAGPALVGPLPMSSYGENETRPRNYSMIPCIKY